MIQSLFTIVIIELCTDLFFGVRIVRFSTGSRVLLGSNDPGHVLNSIFLYSVSIPPKTLAPFYLLQNNNLGVTGHVPICLDGFLVQVMPVLYHVIFMVMLGSF